MAAVEEERRERLFSEPQNLPLAAGFMVLQRENVPRRFICAIKEATDLICVTVISIQPF